MGVLTIRNVPQEVHDGLKALAKEHGRSTEAEVRAILADVVMPPDRIGIATQMFDLFKPTGLTDAEVDAINAVRDTTPPEPLELP